MERELLVKEVQDLVEEYFNKSSLDYLMCSCEERVLVLLVKSKGPIYPKQLSEAMNVTMPRITMILNGMETKELIERRTSPDDRRKVEVVVTRKGRNLAKKRKKKIDDYVNEVTKDMDESEIQTIIKFSKESNTARSKGNAAE